MIHLVLGYRSRFDLTNGFFCGTGRDLAYDLFGECSVSYADEPWPAAATHIILCGAGAWKLRGHDARHVGVVYQLGAQRYVCSWHPQDAADVRDVESGFQGLDEDDEAADDSMAKDSAPTQRVNYRFWLKAHAAKLQRGTWAAEPFTMMQIPLASLDTSKLQSRYMYLDIETHPPTDTVQCLSVAFDTGPVFAMTIYDYNGKLQPGAVQAMRWLTRAMRRYTTVAHNIMFDLPFLAMLHGIPWGHSAEDTMAMWHRMFPEADKSLAHLIQYFTNEPYHKDSAGTFTPYNTQQQMTLLRYNARDVHTLRLIHRELNKVRTPSMNQVNESSLDYMFAGLRGFPMDLRRHTEHTTKLKRRHKQLLRVFKCLVGTDINPNSGPQLAAWLFEGGLGYKPRGTTDAGAPSTDATTMLKLYADNPDNVALRVLLEIKDLSKQLSMLDFEPYTQSPR
jgi:hypothetical protein